ncbi:MAG: nitroreductase family protein [Bilophila wadsworthia]
MTKRFIPVLAACLFLMVGTAQAATSLAFPPPDTKGESRSCKRSADGRQTARSPPPLSDKLLGDLLWAAYGVNRPNGKRTIPTAQNRQDLEIYVLRSDGAWLYDAPKHSLEQVSSSDLRNFLAGQGFVREAPVGLVYVTDTQKNSKELFAAMHTGSAYQNVGLFCLRGAAQRRPRFLRRRRPRFRPRPPQIQAYPDFPKHRMGRIEKTSHNERQRKEPERNTVQALFFKIRRFPPGGAPSARPPRQSEILGR